MQQAGKLRRNRSRIDFVVNSTVPESSGICFLEKQIQRGRGLINSLSYLSSLEQCDSY